MHEISPLARRQRMFADGEGGDKGVMAVTSRYDMGHSRHRERERERGNKVTGDRGRLSRQAGMAAEGLTREKGVEIWV